MRFETEKTRFCAALFLLKPKLIACECNYDSERGSQAFSNPSLEHHSLAKHNNWNLECFFIFRLSFFHPVSLFISVCALL